MQTLARRLAREAGERLRSVHVYFENYSWKARALLVLRALR
jgi:hypothetical protein